MADRLGFTLGINEYSDLDSAEFADQLMGIHEDPMPDPRVKHYTPSTTALPNSVDWRKKGIVTKVKRQQPCNSCWAFSATGALEGQHALSTGKLVSLSEQNLIDCLQQKGYVGCCTGGWPHWAFEYIINNGIATEASYPYVGKDGVCRFNASNVGATCKDYTFLPQGDENALTNAIATVGPISVIIDASHDSFRMYRSGVYYEPKCSQTNLTHAVLVVGYGVKNNQEVYIVKNSWGPTWGVRGYMYMSRNCNNHCGIASMASYPKV